ncbi:S4 domain-containing protein YaaA [Salisediminibacterium selenitireducens]|uniref:S4 domain protein YaaA n=1 Tax=Bacillus selenitireducens (strain ATCC 700615 / DSM 15326 / MLS10) TaxID=439292 RepID=D6XUZ7_BACIE|nr:S4 domain-containing protein YaaA [Salisediminibacterium selenitireducens]ADH97555.1 S4 domain protein YaaA [[Bacillus] selenitireducens MLS10]
MEERVTISTEYMTLGQVLKEVAAIGSGGQAKWFLKDIPVFINDEEEPETRRGRKLYPGDTVDIDGQTTVLIEADA